MDTMVKMMDALVKPEKGPGLVLKQVPVPTPGPGEVLIKIRKTAGQTYISINGTNGAKKISSPQLLTATSMLAKLQN